MNKKILNCNNLKTETLEEVFKDFYVIPYSIEYTWEKRKVLEFITNIYNNFTNCTLNYFIDTIVIYPDFDKITVDESIVYQLLYGEQELITIYILFCTLKHYFNDYIYSDSNPINEFICNNKLEYKLTFKSSRLRNLLAHLCQEEVNIKSLNYSFYKENLISAYETIENFISETFRFTNRLEVLCFWTYLITKVNLVRVKITDVKFEYNWKDF